MSKYVWERRESESDEAFAAFVLYRDMGRSRTIEAAYRKSVEARSGTRKKSGRPAAKKGSSRHWEIWSSDNEWVARSLSFDDHNDRVELEARDMARAKEAAKWEARRLAQREREWEMSVKLQAKAESLMDQDLEARAGDSARLAESGSKLARLSAGMETDHTKVTGAIAVMEVDLSDKDDDQLRSYIGGLAAVAAKLAG